MKKTDIKYKDRLFSFIFGSEEHKDWTLSLYNAVNGSDYSDPDGLELNTIKQVLYLGMRNDLSFLIGFEINLYEQQSTYNPNMPLRMLQYLANLYDKYVSEHKYNKYGEKQIPLTAPRLVVFYNGDFELEDEVILRLSDAFPDGADYDVEVVVRMININYGHNKELLENCEPLCGYSWFVEQVKVNRVEMDLDDAVDLAIDEMPEDFSLKAFLKVHRMEVRSMLLTEYDEKEQMELFKEDGREEGRKEGRKEGREEGRKEGGLKVAKEMLDMLGFSEEQSDKYMSELRAKNLI